MEEFINLSNPQETQDKKCLREGENYSLAINSHDPADNNQSVQYNVQELHKSVYHTDHFRQELAKKIWKEYLNRRGD